MRGILRKSSIRDKILIFLIVFSIFMILASIIYRYLFYPVYSLKLPYVYNISDNETEIGYYGLNLTTYDIIKMSINGVLNQKNLNFTNSNTSVEFISEIDDYLLNNSLYMENYELYYTKLNIIYPQYSFILCINDSCGAFVFTSKGITNIPISYINNINNTLIIYLSYSISEKILNYLEYQNGNFVDIIKNGLENGEIKVINDNQLIQNILNIYNLNISAG
ncbi:hypothetical protein Nps_01925 [Candidatus Nanopusillus acidilobi]|nr:hypothetical protein Nps_01925 [Candidatus Nanopusillus acidilobi]